MITYSIENVSGFEEAEDSEFGFIGSTGVIRDNGTIIGFYTIEDQGESIYLNELEILDNFKSQGYGTNFINHLFENYNNVVEVYGRSTINAVTFYKNQGAVYPDVQSFEDVLIHVEKCLNGDEDEEDENSFYRDFIISRMDWENNISY